MQLRKKLNQDNGTVRALLTLASRSFRANARDLAPANAITQVRRRTTNCEVPRSEPDWRCLMRLGMTGRCLHVARRFPKSVRPGIGFQPMFCEFIDRVTMPLSLAMDHSLCDLLQHGFVDANP